MAIPPRQNWKNGQRLSEYRERIVKRHGKDTETGYRNDCDQMEDRYTAGIAPQKKGM